MNSSQHERVGSDYGRTMIADSEARRKEANALRESLKEQEQNSQARRQSEPEAGVSVIVPTFHGEERIDAMLESLSRQVLCDELFEVIVVENGDRQGVGDRIDDYRRKWPSLNIRYFYQKLASAGAARNLGIDVARRSKITFLDDDDRLGSKFLSEAISRSSDNNIVVSPIVNVHAEGRWEVNNTLNARIALLHGASHTRLVDSPWVLGFNACKLVPTWMVRNLRFQETLRSGEDLVFWAHLAVDDTTELAVVRPDPEAAYFRGMRDDSVSRRTASFEFAVAERLECLSALEDVTTSPGSSSAKCVDQLARAQAGFIARYIAEHPQDETRVLDTIESYSLRSFPWSILNDGLARDLAFVYCFAPFSDTSAVVASKAIAERGRIVDVVTNDMSAVRRLDPAVSALADRWIDKRTVVKAFPSFAGWVPIADFAEQAVAVADRDHAIKGPYRSVYSRALWVGSHVAAALFKLSHWNVKWTAEFSDPLRRDAEGNPRAGKLGDGVTWDRLVGGIRSRGLLHFQPETIFDLVEVATFVLADELIFTNSNQLDYMLSLTGDRDLRELVQNKAIVREHPQPSAEAYDVVKTSYRVPENVVNIAYFGSFYPNRGIDDVFVALANSKQSVRRNVRLHVFSNKTDEVKAAVARLGVGPLVYAQGYLSYMEFLNATRLFDVLLVNDIERNSAFEINPFLPSKLSDYRGSGSRIWALVDDGSPLSRKSCDFRSPVGNSAAMISTLEEISRLEPK